ncbi:MAG: NADH-quinone oxidoreductase subunit L [Desulfobacterales bacterium]
MTLIVMKDWTFVTAAVTSLLPFVAFVLIIVFTRSRAKLSAGLSIGAVTGSLAGAVFLLVRYRDLKTPIQYAGQWLVSGAITVPIGILLDPLNLLMLTLVAAICFLVQVYSLGYMAGDTGFSRYYAFMSLFAWAMISLVLSSSMLQLYVFWELVGLSSYLLIGFWYEKFSASEAGKKAFVMTRFGDVAFMLGLLLLLMNLGDLDILKMNSPVVTANMTPGLITLSALLIFGGIVGKSAQFPLLTWLPDAMEGPTPVSALLHSATMVAAGVFLFARLFPFFNQSPTAMTVCLVIGTISMLLASTMAMVSRDVKQVWAYSTISQLGFMIMGLAAGSYVAGVFHLTTHAGFKALLFLCSGVFIHTYESNDMFEIGRQGGRRLKTPMICMVIAAAALSGLPPFSGFFSKEMILVQLAGLNNPLWLASGLAGVFLTAYYAFRLIFIILFPKNIQNEKAADDTAVSHGGKKEHDHYRMMAWPLILLAAITLVLGFCQNMLDVFLTGRPAGMEEITGNHHAWLLYAALGLAVIGIVLAWLEFGRGKAGQIGFAERIPTVKALFLERWYLDRMYRRLLDVVIYRGISNACTKNDNQVIDGSIDVISKSTVRSGRMISDLHLSMIQYKLMAIFVVILFLALYFFATV